jgi:hypothetical protein
VPRWRRWSPLLTLFATACLPIPHRDLVKPTVTFAVRDSAGQPLPSAEVVVYSVVEQGVGAVTPVQVDAWGIGHLSQVMEWHAVTQFLPDGEAPWTWAWCAVAPGHSRAAGRFFLEPTDTIRVVLASSPKAWSCPTHPLTLRDVPAR